MRCADAETGGGGASGAACGTWNPEGAASGAGAARRRVCDGNDSLGQHDGVAPNNKASHRRQRSDVDGTVMRGIVQLAHHPSQLAGSAQTLACMRGTLPCL